MQAGEQPPITEDERQDHQWEVAEVAAMGAAAAGVREVATTALLEAKVADARGAELLRVWKPQGSRAGQPL